jgi:hypothetical protein
MTNRLSIQILIQLGVILFVGLIAGFFAIISAGAFGGVAMGVAPEFTFGLVEGIVCQEGTSLEYSSIQRSFHLPGESEPHVDCVSEDGARKDVLLPAILAVLGLTFVAMFLAAFIFVLIPTEIVVLLVSRRVLSRQS